MTMPPEPPAILSPEEMAARIADAEDLLCRSDADYRLAAGAYAKGIARALLQLAAQVERADAAIAEKDDVGFVTWQMYRTQRKRAEAAEARYTETVEVGRREDDRWREHVARLEAALRDIASCDWRATGDVVDNRSSCPDALTEKKP